MAAYYYLELTTEDSAMAKSRAAFPVPARIRPGRKRRPSTTPELGDILNLRTRGAAAPSDWAVADLALYAQSYRDAIDAYAAAADASPREQAKHGYCLGMVGDLEAAESLLSEANVGTHPEALAVLAYVVGGAHGRRMHGFGSNEVVQRAAARRARVDALFTAALAVERPPLQVFNLLFWVRGTYDAAIIPNVERARALYPDWAWPHAVAACKRRVAGTLDPSLLDDLMRTLADANHNDVFHEAYVHAMQLGRWDDAERVIEALEALVREDTETGERTRAGLAEMRAMLSLHRARAGESEAYELVADPLADFISRTGHAAGGPDPSVPPKFLLQVALETCQPDRMADAAKALIERAWDSHGEGGEDLDSWSPWIGASSLNGVVRFGHFGFAFTSRWREVDATLTGAIRERWRVLLAADAVLHLDPDLDQVQLLRALDVEDVPWWIARAVYEAHATHTNDPTTAGEVLAQLAERAAGLPPQEDERHHTPLESLEVSVEDLDDAIALFEGALAWLERNATATGRTLLEQWGEDLAEVEGGKAVLSRLAALSLARGDSDSVRALKALADTPDTPKSRLAAVLTRYPQPEDTRVEPRELSLLEAATLVALLRACPLDHVHWTLAPLASAGQSFEPRHNFIGTLFALMAKGVITIDATTPAGVVTAEADGRLKAHLSNVVWRISAHTLALQRAIRDLPRARWPQAWRDHAAPLARDLGVEEMVAYLEYLLDERDLPAPKMDDVRTIFRTQLEHLSMSQCYYLAHKTMRETLDYQAKYRPGRTHVESRVLTLLRGNGERAIEQGWDTHYKRIGDLPPSLLWEALHDVLTGWGRAAFDQPVMALKLDDPPIPPTHH